MQLQFRLSRKKKENNRIFLFLGIIGKPNASAIGLSDDNFRGEIFLNIKTSERLLLMQNVKRSVHAFQ